MTLEKEVCGTAMGVAQWLRSIVEDFEQMAQAVPLMHVVSC